MRDSHSRAMQFTSSMYTMQDQTRGLSIPFHELIFELDQYHEGADFREKVSVRVVLRLIGISIGMPQTGK